MIMAMISLIIEVFKVNLETMSDFEELLDKAHQKEIKIILDLVFNHTSDEHFWFQESKKSKNNPYRDYYIWKEGNEGDVPNNWTSCFQGSAWELDEKTNELLFAFIF